VNKEEELYCIESIHTILNFKEIAALCARKVLFSSRFYGVRIFRTCGIYV